MADSLPAVLSRIQVAGNAELVAAASTEGFLIDAARRDDVALDAEEFAAVAVNGVMVAQALGREISRGAMAGAFFEYEQGTVIVSVLDDEVALVILAGKETNLGRLRLITRRYRDDVVQAARAAV
ncbi:MAG TPA: roadblock/LC7 domain-containing protein [Thermomicrobiales bacterium]|nr:roadblock/LC7 domain-containing protein [Thermomicrobiales bacterium]